mmetsp:Transcript_34337/g.68377  ORF Transcript_34337/g.68377 Transcript_34337/m.68377 type:complete len:122 (-) Transcript_34337:248-613(-)
MSKKVDVSFMKMVNSDDEWQREVKDAGSKLLCIIDVYTVIWGPCEMLAGHFSNTYFDLGEKYGMRFVRATADNITDLKEKYLGSSEPRFLFYLDGEEIGNVQGSNIPAIMDIITTKSPPPS